MGTIIHLTKIERLFEKSLVVDFKSIERMVRVDKSRSNYAKLMISNLLKKGKIHKVGKGYYSKYNESSLAVFAFKPAYLGLQSALSHFGLWEQETIPVIITPQKVRRGIRNVLGTNILVRNTNKKYFFGFEWVKEGDFYLPYSDLEKTFIDFIIFNENIDRSILKVLRKKINRDKLENYLRRYPQKTKDRIKTALTNSESR
jgi:predicted transcriptional regulator of viral defense system